MSDTMATVKIYGASDDLIEVEGALSEEFNAWEHEDGDYLAFSDGTVLHIRYGGDGGFWRINRRVKGTAAYEKHEGVDERDDYSDIVTLTGDLQWVVFGPGFVRATE